MSELVRTLSQGLHPVELALRPEKSLRALKECLERRYVHVKFTDTRGGTELGVRIDESTAQLALGGVDGTERTVHISGNLSLDYVPVRCIVDVNLDTYEGAGHLERLQ